jgi:DNA-binding transcriptional regulator YhcF (GntR family)
MDFNNNFPIYLQIIDSIKQDIVINIKFIGHY